MNIIRHKIGARGVYVLEKEPLCVLDSIVPRGTAFGRQVTLMLKGGSNMPKHRCSLFLGLFILLTSTANAQGPRSAQDYFNRGWDQFTKGDYERAVANFTRVIEVDRAHKAGLRKGQNWNADSLPANDASDSDHIVFVSPLTAPAY